MNIARHMTNGGMENGTFGKGLRIVQSSCVMNKKDTLFEGLTDKTAHQQAVLSVSFLLFIPRFSAHTIPEVIKMMDAPKLFLDALEQNPRAKERFYMLTNMEKKLVVDEARQITDPERMRAHVSNIRE